LAPLSWMVYDSASEIDFTLQSDYIANHDIIYGSASVGCISPSVITLKRPHNPSRLLITNRSFYHSAPVLWNALPKELRLYNSGHLGNRSTSNILYCLLFYFT
jgi:hypothetical protein